MSPKNVRTISHPEQEISLLLSNFSKDVIQLTDWQIYKEFVTIGKWCKNIQGLSPKIFRKVSHTELEISLYLSDFSKDVSQITDWHNYKKFRTIFNQCRNILETSSKDFRKIFHPELETSLQLSNFSKEVSQPTDWQTYMKFRIIWN